MTSLPDFDQLNPEQLRAIAGQLMQRIETLDQKVESMVAVTLWQPGPVTVVSSLSV
ncbi:transposase [Pseudomonas syringae pv. tomato T1]|nr:transposase [Pseudomonas syringae pv. tomato T1]